MVDFFEVDIMMDSDFEKNIRIPVWGQVSACTTSLHPGLSQHLVPEKVILNFIGTHNDQIPTTVTRPTLTHRTFHFPLGFPCPL